MPDSFDLVNFKDFKDVELTRIYNDALRSGNIKLVTRCLAEFRRREAEAKKGK